MYQLQLSANILSPKTGLVVNVSIVEYENNDHLCIIIIIVHTHIHECLGQLIYKSVCCG